MTTEPSRLDAELRRAVDETGVVPAEFFSLAGMLWCIAHGIRCLRDKRGPMLAVTVCVATRRSSTEGATSRMPAGLRCIPLETGKIRDELPGSTLELPSFAARPRCCDGETLLVTATTPPATLATWRSVG